MVTEWITTAANVVIAFGVLIGIHQLIATNKQIELLTKQLDTANKQLDLLGTELKADHDRSRREMAIEVINNWINSANLGYSGLENFVESLTPNCCDDLWNKKEVTVDARHAVYISNVLNCEIPILDSFIKLNPEYARKIRANIVEYLNCLEAIACAWRYNVADQEILEEEFKTIILLNNGEISMNNFISRTGVYPSLKLWTKKIYQKRNEHSVRPPTA